MHRKNAKHYTEILTAIGLDTLSMGDFFLLPTFHTVKLSLVSICYF